MGASGRWRVVVSGVVVAAALVAFGHRCSRLVAAPDGHLVKGSDFYAFYDVGEAALRHLDVYAAGPRMHMNVFYAPNFPLLMAPFALLPPYAAAFLWYLLKLAAVACLVRWLDQALRREAPALAPRARVALLVLPFLAAWNPLTSEFKLGQANLLVLFFSVLTVRALARGRPLRAALWFSIAAVKITPLALLPWLAGRRQWRFFLALLPVGAAWLCALAAWWGPDAVPGLFRGWIVVTATRKAIPEIVAYYENQSLQGAAARLAGVVPALARPALGMAAYQWLWILPCAALALALVVVAARDRFRPRIAAEEFAVASLLMLLASSDSRYAHHVQLLVPLAVLAIAAARGRMLERLPRLGPWLSAGAALLPPEGAEDVRLRRWTGGLLAASFAVYVLLGRDVVGPALNHALRALSIGTALDVALAVFLVGRLLRRPAAAAGDGPPGAPAAETRSTLRVSEPT